LNGIERVLIVGTGWVGRQVAAQMAQHGITVGLVDREHAIAAGARDWMLRCTQVDDPLNLRSQAESSIEIDQIVSQPKWLTLVSVLPAFQDLSHAELERWKPDLVLECVSEQLSLKKRVLRKICELVGPGCIVASNSSYFVPSVLAQFVSHPERFAHLHFHVPVLKESVADIVGCAQTSPETLDALAALTSRIGHFPLRLRHEHPGYVFNWLLQAVLKAALELVAADVVDPQDVDRSWTAVTGMRLGPFGMMDQIGLDVIEQVLSNGRWAKPLEVDQQKLLEMLRPLLKQGKLGIKSGAGFYNYQLNSESK
jgi:3-hydroxybutyryl-CoA dehydrogenase